MMKIKHQKLTSKPVHVSHLHLKGRDFHSPAEKQVKTVREGA
jgi:hypothetical protein